MSVHTKHKQWHLLFASQFLLGGGFSNLISSFSINFFYDTKRFMTDLDRLTPFCPLIFELTNKSKWSNEVARVKRLSQVQTKQNQGDIKFKSEKEVATIIQNWTRVLTIKSGWIHDFDKIVAKYAKHFKLLNILNGHKKGVNTVRFSADGKKIVSASDDRTIRIWDVALGKEIQTLEGHIDNINTAEFSPDKNMVVSCSQDKTIRLWDVNSGKEILTLKGHLGPVWCAHFSPDGKWIISGSYDETIRLWDLASGKEIKKN
ncbi:WD-40 repeat protein [Reticulomyxa filosa]|uniref:WD-40 repeat protein n=1 Tax=Reticulomyxa filosa TaxID=46433 RepID=X6MPN7_RETFI|nr:WD-40 repeat protein [Reticulomyxa filosa]|eukprot:ETO15953.1 WD-40 repeat protein [Reticulomyxa filosa]